MCRYLCADIICFKMRTVFRERIWRKTKSFQEQMMSKDKCQFIFSNKIEAIVFIILQRFCNAREKMLTNSLPYAAWVVFFWVISGTTYGKKIPFFCNIHKTLYNLEKNLKLILIIIEIMFKNWGLSLGWCSQISPSFSLSIFGLELRLDQSRANKNVWWIVITYTHTLYSPIT